MNQYWEQYGETRSCRQGKGKQVVRIRWILLTLIGSCATCVCAEPVFEQQDIFVAGEQGYALFRIPGIVVTSKGTLLVYCEARRTASGDWGEIELMIRRSTDGGRTWSPATKLASPPAGATKNPVALQQKLAKSTEITMNNPVAIVDRGGAVHFLYCVEYARCFYLRSDDDGATFSKPVEITRAFEQFRPQYDWRVLATGPGHGIQLATGRLLAPVWLSTGTGGHAHRPSCVSVIYSDDAGRTWNPGQIVVADPKPKNPSETVAVELADGRVMLNIRHEDEPHVRAVSYSADGATGWTPIAFDSALPEPVCMASMVRFSTAPAMNRLLFVNPHNPAGRDRKNVTVKLSYDEGKTWPVARAIEPGPSGYSDIAVGPGGTIYCLYERGSLEQNRFRPRSLSLARFNLDWLSDGRDQSDR